MEFLALGAIGLATTLLVDRKNVFQLFTHSPYVTGNSLIQELSSNVAGQCLFVNVLFQAFALFTVLYVDCNRPLQFNWKTMMYMVISPLILIAFGPSTALPFAAYVVSKDYPLALTPDNRRKQNSPAATRVFYLLVSMVTTIFVVFSILSNEGEIKDSRYSNVFVIVPFLLSGLSGLDTMVERFRQNVNPQYSGDSSDPYTSRKCVFV